VKVIACILEIRVCSVHVDLSAVIPGAWESELNWLRVTYSSSTLMYIDRGRMFD